MKQVAKFFAAPLLIKKRKKTPPPDSRFVKKSGKEENWAGKERTRKGEEGTDVACLHLGQGVSVRASPPVRFTAPGAIQVQGSGWDKLIKISNRI